VPETLVYETRRFAKALGKLSEPIKVLVEDEIENIIADPLLGEKKKGDLSHLWIHKFKIDNQEWLLGYNWNEEQIVIHLLQLGSHENYYLEARRQRKGDLKKI
jgi:mRNA-degrading endonuclease RelE of RelBE toxin-antitoxin system